MHMSEEFDGRIKTIIENTVKNCGGTPASMEIELASTMIEAAIIEAGMTKPEAASEPNTAGGEA